MDATGLPIGLFCREHFSVNRFVMEKGDMLFLYTDGLSETLNGSGIEYGIERLSRLLIENPRLAPKELITSCVREAGIFRTSDFLFDDLTLMAIQRVQ